MEHPAPSRRLNDAAMSERAHALIAVYARHGMRPEVDECLTGAKAALELMPLGKTPKSGCRRLAMLVSSYFVHLVPNDGWEFVASERLCHVGGVPVSKPDLVWGKDGMVLFQELKLSLRVRLEGAVRDQVARHLAGGISEFGERFAWVSLCCLEAPSDSLHINPNGDVVKLNSTEMWAAPAADRFEESSMDAFSALYELVTL